MKKEIVKKFNQLQKLYNENNNLTDKIQIFSLFIYLNNFNQNIDIPKLKALDSKFNTNFFHQNNLLINKVISSFNINDWLYSKLKTTDLIYLFENIQTDNKNKSGVFYTPLILAEHIAKKYKNNIQNQLSILDPAVGGGILLYSLIKKLKKENPEIKLKITVYDINLEAINFCKYIFNSDNIEFINNNFLLTNINTKYDIILANPPYGLSRNSQIEKDELVILKEKYKEIIKGKTNKYSLFTFKISKLLKEGGSASIIIPNSWLGIKSMAVFRKYLFDHKLIKSIEILHHLTFTGISVETVILNLSKDNNNFKIKKFDKNFKNTASSDITTSDCLNIFDSQIPPIWNEDIKFFLNKILKSSCTLKDYGFVPRISIQAYNSNKFSKEDIKNKVCHFDTQLTKNHFPYLEGRDIQAFTINKESSYLFYGDHLAEPQKIEYYNCPRIAVREILKTKTNLSSVFLEKCYFYNKSVLNIIGNKTKEEFKALSLILNSDLGGLIIYLLGRKTQRRLFPKIVNADLVSFPLANNFSNIFKELSNLYDKSVVKPDIDKINLTVSRIYGIDKDIIYRIKRQISEIY